MFVRLCVVAAVSLSVCAFATGRGGLQGKALAVFELSDPNGLAKGVAEALSDQVRGAGVEVTRDAGARVISRETMVGVLKAGTFSCNQGGCGLEAAKFLDADYLVTGELVGKPGTLFLTLKVFEARQGTLLAQRLVKSDSEFALLERVRAEAAEVLREAFGQALRPDTYKEDLAREVKARFRDLTGCYQKALKRDPALKGRVVMGFTLQPDGRATGVRVLQNTVGSDAVGECMQASIRDWTLAVHPEEPTEVTYPFVFAPGY